MSTTLEEYSPEKFVEMYRQLPQGELTMDQLPEPLREEILVRGLNMLINDNVLTTRGVLYLLVTEVWSPGIGPSL